MEVVKFVCRAIVVAAVVAEGLYGLGHHRQTPAGLLKTSRLTKPELRPSSGFFLELF